MQSERADKKKMLALLDIFLCPCRRQMLYQSSIVAMYDWKYDWNCYLMTGPLVQVIFARGGVIF